MPNKLDETQVRKVAKLARLEISDEEVQIFSTQLSSILEYIERLNELDVSEIEPLAHCLPVHNCLRNDEIRPSLGTEAVLQNASERAEDYFRVPKILDEGPGA